MATKLLGGGKVLVAGPLKRFFCGFPKFVEKEVLSMKLISLMFRSMQKPVRSSQSPRSATAAYPDYEELKRDNPGTGLRSLKQLLTM